jgi:hypothetical protein
MKLTKREQWVLDYLESIWEANYPINGGWTSPSEIGGAYNGGHSSTGSPICLSLVKKGRLERNEKGHYRLVKSKVWKK